MAPKQSILIALLSVLIFIALPSVGNVDAQTKTALVFSPRPEASPAGAENLSFCPKIQISSTGGICESPYGFTARLDFPQIDIDSVLAGEQFFPNIEATFPVQDQQVNGVRYRNIAF